MSSFSFPSGKKTFEWFFNIYAFHQNIFDEKSQSFFTVFLSSLILHSLLAMFMVLTTVENI